MNSIQKLSILIISATLLNAFHGVSQISSQNTDNSLAKTDSLLQLFDKTQNLIAVNTDSTLLLKRSQVIHSLLFQSGAIYTDLLSIRNELGQTESIIKASELYLAIQADEMTTKSILDLKKSIRKRAYISMGIGLASSALFFIGNNGSGGKSTKNIAGVVSLSIPIISLLTMNKQLKSIKVPPTYDKEIFKNQGILVDIHSINFNKNYIKMTLNLLKKMIGDIDNNHAANLLKLKNATIPKEVRQCAISSLEIIDRLAFANFQIEKLNALLKDNQYLIGFDQSAILKFKVLEKELNRFTQNWLKYKATLKTINNKVESYIQYD